jgi:chromosome segregation ATPase
VLIGLVIVLGVLLAASLAFNLGVLGNKAPVAASSNTSSTSSSSAPRRDDDAVTRASKLENELEKKRKELDEVKKAQGELKTELKDVKKKLHDQRENAKTGDDLTKARAEVERQASIQLETTRSELANALSEMTRLRSEVENKGRKQARPAVAAVEATAVAAAEAPVKTEERPQVVVQRVIRELSDTEKEKMQRLEQQSSADKKKAIELAAELRNIKGKIDREKREAKRIYEEGRLSRDKFRAVEIRLNRTLLENDLLKGAIRGLEQKTGLVAEHPTPTAAEIAGADATMKAKHVAEDKASEEAQAKLEAAEATASPDEVPPPTPSAPVAEVTVAGPSA